MVLGGKALGKVIAVLSGKGGTGKTSVCAGVAIALAAGGNRVLCIDCDIGLRNLDIPLGLSDMDALSFYDVAQGGYPLSGCCVHPDYPSLCFLTAPMNKRPEDMDPEAFAKFDLSAIITIMPIALAAMMEHIGDIAAISATTGENYIEDPGLHRTLLGDGLATSFAGFIGGPANTTYGENTGVLALSKVYDPFVIRIAAVLAVILSLSPKFAALINLIPTAVIGGISFILYGMISAIGVRNIVENKVDFTKSRNLIVAAVILVCALGLQSDTVSFTIGSANITLSPLAVASIAGIVLNAIFPDKDKYVFRSKNQKNK